VPDIDTAEPVGPETIADPPGVGDGPGEPVEFGDDPKVAGANARSPTAIKQYKLPFLATPTHTRTASGGNPAVLLPVDIDYFSGDPLADLHGLIPPATPGEIQGPDVRRYQAQTPVRSW
jgi:hypothetical protein